MTADRVVRNFYFISGIYNLSASFIWGVNTLFLLDSGLTLEQTFIANAFFTAGMMLFEIPTGVVADTAGRRTSFLLSVFIVMIATVGYVVVGAMHAGIVLFAVFSVLLGLGFTFYSGAVEAWLVDALNATDFSGELDHVFARGAQITGATMLVGTVSGGIVGSLNLAYPFMIRAFLLAIVFVIAFRGMHDLGYTPRPLTLSRIPQEMSALTRNSIKYGIQEPHLRLLIFANLFMGGFSIWAFYASQPYFLDLFGDPDAIWVSGIIAALLSVFMILGNVIAERLTHRRGRRTTIIFASLAIMTVGMIVVGLVGMLIPDSPYAFWIGVAAYLIGVGGMGAMGPVRQSYMHQIIPSEQRATVISVDAMFSSAGGVVGQPALGRLAQVQGIGTGYVVGGAITSVTLPLILLLRRLGGEADILNGTVKTQEVE